MSTLTNPYQNISPMYLKLLFTETQRKIQILLQDLTNLYGIFHVSLNFLQTEKNLISILIPTDLQNLIIEKKLLNNHKDHSQSQKPSKQKVRKSKETNRVYCGRKALLGQEQQKQVGILCSKYCNNGQTLTLEKLCNLAKSVSNHSNFTPSIGWAQNFLKKNPLIKEIYNKSRQRFCESKATNNNLNDKLQNPQLNSSSTKKKSQSELDNDLKKDQQKLNENMNTLYGEYVDICSSNHSQEHENC